MSESNKELVATSVGQDALSSRKPRRGLSRRAFLAGAVGTAVLGAEAVAVAVTRGVTPKKVVEFFTPQEGKPTEEQEKAAKFFVTAGEENLVRSIIVQSVKDGEKIISVKLRDEPEAEAGEELNFKGGRIIDQLEIGVAIDKAIVVEGIDPRDSKHKDKGLWYAFPDPKNPGRMVFAHPSGFAPNEKLYKVTPFEVRR